MKTIILYSSPKKLSRTHYPVWVGIHKYQPILYVRAEECDASVEEALEHAKPREGETVLNTIEVE